MKIGQNVGEPGQYGFKDVFISNYGWIAQPILLGTNTGCSTSCNYGSLLQLDANGYPNAGIPQHIGQVRQFDNTYRYIDSAYVETYFMRENSFEYPLGEYYVYWEGEGVLEFGVNEGASPSPSAGNPEENTNITWDEARNIVINTLPGVYYGTTTVTGSFDVTNHGSPNGVTVTGNVPGLAVYAGFGNRRRYIISDNSPGVHYARIFLPNWYPFWGHTLRIRKSSAAPNHIRNISIVAPNRLKRGGAVVTDPSGDRAFADPNSPYFFKTKPFHPLYLNWLDPFPVLRFMPAMGTNSVDEAVDKSWLMRRPRGYMNQSGNTLDGRVGISMAYEYIYELCNEIKADAWININAAADEDHMRQLAKMMKDNLDPNLNVWIEVGNEATWNFAPGFNTFFVLNNYANVNNLAGGAGEALHVKQGQAFKAFVEEFGTDSSRVKRVLAGQFVNPWHIDQAIIYHNARNQPWDYISVTWYFGNQSAISSLGESATPAQINNVSYATWTVPSSVNDSEMDHIKDHVLLARSYGKKIALYEGGTHTTYSQGGTENWANVKLAKFDPTIRNAYKVVIDSLRRFPEIELINHFMDYGGTDRWCSGGTPWCNTRGTDIPVCSFGSVPTPFSDTTIAHINKNASALTLAISTFPGGTFPFGTFTLDARRKHLVWKELLANMPNQALCAPTTTSHNVGPGLAQQFKSGNSQYINVSNINKPDAVNGTYTTEFWVKPQMGNTLQDIVAYTGNNTGNIAYNSLRMNALNRIQWLVTDNAGTVVANLEGPILELDKWYHIAAVKNTTTHVLYVNGSPQATAPAGSGSYNGRRVSFGGAIVYDQITNPFRGQLDEVRMWNTPISQYNLRDWMCKKLTSSHPDYTSNLSYYFNFNTVSGLNVLDARTQTSVGTMHNYSTVVGSTLYPTLISGAPLGNYSTNVYPGSWTNISLSLAHPTTGESLVASNMGAGSPDGAHIYLIDEAPFYNSLPTYYTAISNRVFGVFMANGSAPNYDLSYAYNGNPTALSHGPYNRMVRRANYAESAWVNSGAINDNINRRLNISCRENTRGEYEIGVRLNQRIERPGSGYALRFNDNTGQGGVLYGFKPANNFTISFWGMVPSGGGGNFMRFFNPVGGNSFFISNGFGFLVRHNGFEMAALNPSSSHCENYWSHYTVVKNGTNIDMYTNGMQVASWTDNGNFDFSELHIGSVAPDYSGDLNGFIDELSIWNTALNVNDVKALMTKKITPAHPKYCNLQVYFRFDEGSGSVLENMLGAGDMVLTGHQWSISGAALGDESAYSYNTPYGITMPHPDGDEMQLTLMSLNDGIRGIQLYREDGAAYFTGALPSGIVSYDSSRYWGTYAIVSGCHDAEYTYYFDYNYGSNSRINLNAKNTLKWMRRDDNRDMTWAGISSSNNTTSNVLRGYPSGYSVAGFNNGTNVWTLAPGHLLSECDRIHFWNTGTFPLDGGNNPVPVTNGYRLGNMSGNNGNLYSYYAPNPNCTSWGIEDFNAAGTGEGYMIKVYRSERDEILLGSSTITAFNFPTTVPGAIPSVIGINNACQGSAGILYKLPRPLNINALSYSWKASAGLSVSNSTGDSVYVNVVGLAPSVQYLSVAGVNNYGAGTYYRMPITITGTAANVAVVSGPIQICQNATGVVYTLSGATPAPSSITWSITGGASITASTASTATTSFVTNSVSGAITAYGYYPACGTVALNSLNFDVNRSPSLSLQVVGDSICQSSANNNLYIDIVNSEFGAVYRALGSSGLWGSISGTGGLVKIPINKNLLTPWTTAVVTITAQNNGCPATPQSLTNRAYLLMSTTLTTAELSTPIITPPAACYADNFDATFNITFAGTKGGVTYTPTYIDYDRDWGGGNTLLYYAYGMDKVSTANGSNLISAVNPSGFPYFLSYSQPNSITGTVQAPGCPSQVMETIATFSLTYADAIQVPTRVTDNAGAVTNNPPGPFYPICGGTPTLHYTTAWGGNSSVFRRRITVGTITGGSPNLRLATPSNISILGVNDVVMAIQDRAGSYLPNELGNFGGNYLYVTSINSGLGIFQVSNTRGGAPLTMSSSANNVSIWAAVTIDIPNNARVITLPAKYAGHGLRLYSMVNFANASTMPDPPTTGNNQRSFYVASISGQSFILSELPTGLYRSGQRSQQYYIGRGTITLTNGSTNVTGFNTLFENEEIQGSGDAGTFLRDMNDAFIGQVENRISQTQLTLRSAWTGPTTTIGFSHMKPQQFTTGQSVVITSPTDADVSAYNWSVSPPNAVISIVGTGGTTGYNAATGSLSNNLTETSSQGQVKNGIRIYWNPTFSGNAMVGVNVSNGCGVSQYEFEPYTPGYNRNQVTLQVRRALPDTPEPIQSTSDAFCQNTDLIQFTTSTQSQADGGFQWQIIPFNTTTIDEQWGNDMGAFWTGAGAQRWSCRWSITNTGFAILDNCTAPRPPRTDQNDAFAPYMMFRPQQGYTGELTIRVRAYGCGDMVPANMQATPWVTKTITISGSPIASQISVTGSASICQGDIPPNYNASAPLASSYNWSISVPGSGITGNLVAYFPFTAGNLENKAPGSASAGAAANLYTISGYNYANTTDAAGTANSAFNFSQNGEQLDGPDVPQYNFGNQFTIALWARYNSTGASGQPRPIAMVGMTDWGPYLYRRGNGTLGFQLYSSPWNPIFPQINESPIDLSTFSGSGTMPNNTWTHVALSYHSSSAGSFARVYINGVLSSTVSVAGFNNVYNSSGVLKIATTPNTGWDWEAWNGSLDEVMIFNKAIEAGDVADIYSRTAAPITSDPLSNVGSISGQGALSVVNTFTGSFNILVSANGCGGASSNVILPVTVYPKPTISGFAFSHPSGCAPTASGIALITLSGATTGVGYDFDLKNDFTYDYTITMPANRVVTINSGLINGFVINGINVRRNGSTCNSYRSDAQFTMQGTTYPNSLVGFAPVSNMVCTGSNGAIQVFGTDNGIRYTLLYAGSTLSGSQIGNGGNVILTIPGSILISSIVGVPYTFRVMATSTTCGVVTLAGIAVITANGVSLPGTVSGVGSSEGCIGVPFNLTVSGQRGVVFWEKSIDGGATFTDYFVLENGTATGASYLTPPLTVSGLIYYRAAVDNGACNTVYSNSVVITSTSPPIAGNITGLDYSCPATPLNLTLVGFSGNTLNWSVSNNGTNWTTTGINTSVAGLTMLTNTGFNNYVRVTVARSNCPLATTPSFIVQYNRLPVQGTIAGANTICQNANLPLSIGGIAGAYQWYRSTDGVSYNAIAGATANGYIANESVAGIYYYRAQVATFCGISTTTSQVVTVSSTSFAILSVTSSPYTIPSGTNAILSVSLSGTASYNMQWLRNGVPLIASVSVLGVNTNTLTLVGIDDTSLATYALSFSGQCVNTVSSNIVVGYSTIMRYWVPGGNGNWNSTTNWAATSGGVSGASVPNNNFATAVFDNNSGSAIASLNFGNFNLGRLFFTNANATIVGTGSNAEISIGSTLSGSDFIAQNSTVNLKGGVDAGPTARDISIRVNNTESGLIQNSTIIQSINQSGGAAGAGRLYTQSSAATLTFDGTSVYVHSNVAPAGNRPIPDATWMTGSIVSVTGIADQFVSNLNYDQVFSNVVWNAPAQDRILDPNAATTILGTLTMLNTNGFEYRAATNNWYGSIIQSGGNINLNGSTIYITGNISQPGGNFRTTGAANAILSGNSNQTIEASQINFNNGNTLSFVNNNTGGAGNNTVNIINAHIGIGSFTMSTGGFNFNNQVQTFNGYINTAGTGYIDAGTIGGLWSIRNNSTPTTIIGILNNSIPILKLHNDNGAGYDLGSNLTVTSLLHLSGGASDMRLNANDLFIAGKFYRNNSRTVVLNNAASSVTVGPVGVYHHDVNGNSIPTATWLQGSTASITGITGSGVGNNQQSFWNYVWNNTAQSGDRTFGTTASANYTVNGTFLLLNTNANRLLFKSNAGGHIFDFNNISIVGGNMRGDDACGGTLNLRIRGDYYQAPGTTMDYNVGCAGVQNITFAGGNTLFTQLGSLTGLNTLILNKNSYLNTLSITGNTTIPGNIQFTSGRFITDNYVLYMSGTSTQASSVTGWVYGNLARTIPTGTNVRNFDVGTDDSFNGAIFTFSGVTTAANIQLRVDKGDYPLATVSSCFFNRSINRYWTVSTHAGTTLSPQNYRASFFFNPATEVDGGTNLANMAGFVFYNGSVTVLPATVTGTSIATTPVTSTGVVYFAERILPTVTGIIGSVNVCTGAPTGYTLTGIACNISYQWTAVGGNLNTTSGTNVSCTWTNPGINQLLATAYDGLIYSEPTIINITTLGPVTAPLVNAPNTLVCQGLTINYAVTTSAGLTYNWSLNGTNFASGNNINVPFTSAGIFALSLTATNGCYTSTITSFNVSVPSAPALSTTFTHVTDCGASNGVITISGTGTILPLQYRLNTTSWQVVNTFGGLNNATYTPSVGYIALPTCSISGTAVTITTPSAPSVASTGIAQISGCGLSDGVVTINGSGGNPAYQYSLNSTTWFSSNVFTGLGPNAYTPYIRNASSTACSAAGTTFNITLPGGCVPDVVISEVFNDGSPTTEWTELLVVNDNVDLRNYTIGDNNANIDNWQTPFTFNNIPFWQNIRAGTIIVIRHRGTTSVDTFAGDGFLDLSAQDPNYFGGGSGSTLDLAAGGDLLRVINSLGVPVHALGYDTSPGTSWTTDIAVPNIKSLMHTSTISSGDAVAVCPANDISYYYGNCSSNCYEYSASKTFVTVTGSIGLPNSCTASTTANAAYWQNLRQPSFSSQTLTATGTACQVIVTFTGATDLNHSDNTQGYLVLKNSVNSFTAPANGTAYSVGNTIGSATVVAILDNTVNGGNMSFVLDAFDNDYVRIYAYKYSSDDVNGNSYNIARGRTYNLTQFANIFIRVNNLPTITGINVTHISDCGLINGATTISGSGGSGTLEYSLNATVWQTSPTFAGLNIGTYNTYIRMQSLTFCSTSGTSFTITIPGVPSITGVVDSDITDCGLTNGAVTITGTGGTGALQYSIDNISW
ncbi:MAG: LamG-like jellyroll fold domain-containing protein, partial [Cytophagales bacterium]|nr:LamG-like jellyroll fold domain-containing protein [Cytophagales bacterium]